jgi:HEPN domain-containing protein/predicted nucleotidyltransferase
VEIIRGNFDVEMIILFGSYARDEAVEERAPNGHHFRYQSDFDLYVLMKGRKDAARVNRNKQLRDRLRREIQTPIQIVSETVGHFNHCLSLAQYFYIDIKKEGIVLYDSQRYQLVEPKELNIKQRRKKAEKYFGYWFKGANSFLIDFQACFDREDYEKAAFELHQAVERFYSAILLVFTDHRPKLHDIEELEKRVSRLEPMFLTVFPRTTKEEERLFELLRKAYIEARYNPSYKITHDELAWLAARVKKLQKLTRQACKSRIESFKEKEVTENTQH